MLCLISTYNLLVLIVPHVPGSPFSSDVPRQTLRNAIFASSLWPFLSSWPTLSRFYTPDLRFLYIEKNRDFRSCTAPLTCRSQSDLGRTRHWSSIVSTDNHCFPSASKRSLKGRRSRSVWWEDRRGGRWVGGWETGAMRGGSGQGGRGGERGGRRGEAAGGRGKGWVGKRRGVGEEGGGSSSGIPARYMRACVWLRTYEHECALMRLRMRESTFVFEQALLCMTTCH